MPIKFLCSGCGSNLRVPDGSSGNMVSCPKCQAISVIPTPAHPSTSTPPVPTSPTTVSSSESTSSSAPYPLSQPSSGFGATNGFGENFSNTNSNPWSAGNFQETANPYQAPPDFSQDERLHFNNSGEITPTCVSIGKIINETWHITKNNLGTLWLVFLLMLACGIAVVTIMISLGFVLGLMSQFLPMAVLVMAAVCCDLLQALLQVIPSAGGTLCILTIVRTGRLEMSDFLAGFRRFIPCISYTLIFWPVTVLPLSLMNAISTFTQIENQNGGFGSSSPFMFDSSTPMSPVFFACYLFALIWLGLLSLRFGFGIAFIVDKNASAMEAFKISWNITRGNMLTMIATSMVVCVAAFIMIPLTLFVGLIWIIPFMYALSPTMYLLMSGQSFRNKTQPSISFDE